MTILHRGVVFTILHQSFDNKIKFLEAETTAAEKKAAAITPDFIAALEAFGDKALIERVAEAMAPMALLGAQEHGILPAVGELLKGTQLGESLTKVLAAPKNGNGSSKRADV